MGGFTVSEGYSNPTRGPTSNQVARQNAGAIEMVPISQTIEQGNGIQSFPLTANEMLHFRCAKGMARLPEITAAEISDKSKSNVFVKTVAVGQIIWVCAQVIARAAKGLSISQLELAVTAFSICAAITYVFLIQAVQVPCRPISIPGILPRHKPDDFYMQILFFPGIMEPTSQLRNKIPNDYIECDGDVPTYIVGVILGA